MTTMSNFSTWAAQTTSPSTWWPPIHLWQALQHLLLKQVIRIITQTQPSRTRPITRMHSTMKHVITMTMRLKIMISWGLLKNSAADGSQTGPCLTWCNGTRAHWRSSTHNFCGAVSLFPIRFKRGNFSSCRFTHCAPSVAATEVIPSCHEKSNVWHCFLYKHTHLFTSIHTCFDMFLHG